jgi:hypothetical protein
LHCWKLYRTLRTAELHAKYERLSKACSDSLKQFQNQFENKSVDCGNLSAIYKYVSKKLNCSNGIAPLRNFDGNLVTGDSERAALLNNYFCSVFTVDDGIINTSSLSASAVASAALPVFTPSLVQKHIKQLKTGSDSGPDGLPAIFHNNTASLISYPLSVLFNLSLHTADITPVWKLASVTPIFNKGSSGDPSNYRSISLTCISSKRIEADIKDHLLAHMKISGALSNSHHGFMTTKSTTTHLIELIVKNFQVENRCVMGNHRSKAANIRGFYLPHNTLLGLNELTYS